MKIENAGVNWLESGLPYSSRYEDVYYSLDDELAESQHVFIDANNLLSRWKDCSIDSRVFTIGELGFGSGLNFMQVAKLWSQAKQRPAGLNYLAFEKYPLSRQQLEKIHRRWPQLADQSDELQQLYPDHSSGCHRLCLDNNITLDLYYGDAFAQLGSRYRAANIGVDCWFLDGFSPRLNPEMWEPRLFQLIANTCNPEATLSTYSVAGSVRKALQAVGFVPEKLPGHGRKRHMLRARWNPSAGLESNDPKPFKQQPWFELPVFSARHRKAIVIGAGLAGCSTAFSLANRGWRVTVLDAADSPASGGSGNSQLALRCRLFKSRSSPAEFFLHSFLFANRQFGRLRKQHAVDWHDCGVLQLKSAMNKSSTLDDEAITALYSEQIISPLSAMEASEKAGIELNESAWYLAAGGWINPASLCQAYLAHPNIELLPLNQVRKISRSQQAWLVENSTTEDRESEIVVIANSSGATQFQQCQDLPLQTVRGQITELRSSDRSLSLQAVVSGERTVFPARNDRHVVSASYSNDDKESNPRHEDNRDNLVLASKIFSDNSFSVSDIVGDRVSYRCNSVDHLPIVGMLPDTQAMRERYAQLGKNAHANFRDSGEYLKGLYINVGHGSNGMASCPLSAEFLASMINEENLPLSRDMINAISPTRFLIRDLKKQRQVK